MSKETTDLRKEEIISACEELYENCSFKDITIKLIGEKTSLSRPSIYNYFQTKEEIFLALLKREYEKWIEDLEKIYVKNEKMEKEQFADILAKTVEKRKKLLKLLSMNLYDIEENSSVDSLIDFKKSYNSAIKLVKKLLDKYFKEMNEENKNEFLFSFFPLMFGLYPYAFATKKQKIAMEKANVLYKEYTIYEIAYMSIKKLLVV
ncbi:MAG: TetR/AcrR family transcriptional regulator [Clostridia bacterium]|nr:TetR/AcrR family transcriptional regulator [Clostridia bacterium]